MEVNLRVRPPVARVLQVQQSRVQLCTKSVARVNPALLSCLLACSISVPLVAALLAVARQERTRRSLGGNEHYVSRQAEA